MCGTALRLSMKTYTGSSPGHSSTIQCLYNPARLPKERTTWPSRSTRRTRASPSMVSFTPAAATRA